MYNFNRTHFCDINILKERNFLVHCKSKLYAVHYDQSCAGSRINEGYDDHQTYCGHVEASMFLSRNFAVLHLHFTSWDISTILIVQTDQLQLHGPKFTLGYIQCFTLNSFHFEPVTTLLWLYTCHITIFFSSIYHCNRPFIIPECVSTLFNFWV
jgi:hypothetical protein